MLTKEQFISSILYAFIGDAFAMPMDGLNPQFIQKTYPNGFYTYEVPQPISKHNKLAAGSITEVGGTAYMIMDLLYETDELDPYYFKRALNKYLRFSSVRKHELEENYDNFGSEDFVYRLGLTNITRSLPYTLTHLNDPNFKENIKKLGDFTHKHPDSQSYLLFHNMMLKNLTETMSLPHAVYNSIEYLDKERDKETMYKIIQEYQSTGFVELENLENIGYANQLDDILYSNYPFAIAAAMNDKYSVWEQFLYSIYMGGATSFNCFIIGSIHGILNPDIQNIPEQLLERLHYGHEIRIIDIYDLAEALYKKYIENK